MAGRPNSRGHLDSLENSGISRGDISNRAHKTDGGRVVNYHRGPRKPAEPSPQIKVLLSKANDAFLKRNFEEAEKVLENILRQNEETFGAYTLLSEIYSERGDRLKSLNTLIAGAHLRPKDHGIWTKCAYETLALETGVDPTKRLSQAIYCFGRAIEADPKDFTSRFEKAALHRELGHTGLAALIYEKLLELLPHDTTVLRHLAEVYIERNDVEKAIDVYRESILYYKSRETGLDKTFSWSDVNIYAELFGYSRNFHKGISEIKSLSRWLLGRESECYWDGIQRNDCEWDSDDFPRRVQVDGYIHGASPKSSYGDGLPLELRVKMGIYRLGLGQLDEALGHFKWLEPERDEIGSKLYDYPDLFRDIADNLLEAGHHNEALKFYEPLQHVDGFADLNIYFQMAKSYRAVDNTNEAQQCYETILEQDSTNINARVQLAQIYEEQNMPEKAFSYVSEVIALSRVDQDSRQNLKPGVLDLYYTATSQGYPFQRRNTIRKSANNESIHLSDEAFILQYNRLQFFAEGMRAEDGQAVIEWMEAARILIDDFRASKVLYPLRNRTQAFAKEKGKKHSSSKSRTGAFFMGDMEAMAKRLKASLGHSAQETEFRQPQVHTEYRSTPFSLWLDIFLEYAMCLIKQGQKEEAFQVCISARDSTAFYNSPASAFRIHVCWFTCAIWANDEEACCTITRWFMKEYQFTTDTYRLYSALNRLCKTPVLWYNSPPSQKFILRQIKAMDFALVSETERKKRFEEKASYTAKDKDGNPVVNTEMDVALLMLYGHILYSGTSYAFALNYFLRAYALDPSNPLINLSLSLGYLHYSFKRQSENRHFLFMQGLSFLYIYHEQQKYSKYPERRQEADYNVARALQMTGLAHLAIPYYESVLNRFAEIRNLQLGTESEDFASEAAYNLQTLYSLTGNLGLARKVTEENLVI
ncbi:MAG: transcription factor TFIIIC subunit tfc4 [Trizodia sp. TS-e1964]|nr:MAG: transcription factor TFIIIC subunit tfc4 [Trizodia sp. TS-e1964]